MRFRIRAALAGATVICLAFPAFAEFVKFHGKVVDDKGKPVKDAQVGILWAFDGKKYASNQTLAVGKDGSFAGELDVVAEKPVALLAFDKVQKRGGVMLVAPGNADRDLKLEIDTLVSLTGNFDVSNIRGNPETVEMVFDASAGGNDTAPAFRVELPAKKRFNVKVPGGKYLLRLGCSGGEREPRELIIPDGKPAHDLKEKLVLSPVTSRQAKKAEEDSPDDKRPNKGKAAKEGSAAPPPLNITDARGVPKTMKLSDYKGKWVLLEFWGYW